MKFELVCKECSTAYEPAKISICERCLAPLDLIYENRKIEKHSLEISDRTIWRYFELLPIEDKNNIVDLGSGFTPLLKYKLSC
jgi:threonine synthase